jgi:hypothetical protein
MCFFKRTDSVKLCAFDDSVVARLTHKKKNTKIRPADRRKAFANVRDTARVKSTVRQEMDNW